MSREAGEDGRPDVVAGIGPAAMASDDTVSGEARVTGAAAEPPLYRGALPPGQDEEAHPGDGGGAADRGAGDPGGLDDPGGFDEIGGLDMGGQDDQDGEGGHDDDDGREVPGALIERAEPVEPGEPGPVLAPPRQRPRLLLALGFVLLAVVIVGGAIAIVGSVTHGFKKPVKVTYTKSPVFSLKTGECLDPRGQSYTLISCDSPHEAEVFATFNLTGTSWPGSTTVAAAASSGCATRLTSYLNPQLAVSLASTYVYPDATAWQAGTRTVICEVRAASGQLTGSVRGASATAG